MFELQVQKNIYGSYQWKIKNKEKDHYELWRRLLKFVKKL